MKSYTIQITDAQDKALAHVAFDPQEWIQNFVDVRCNIAVDEIVNAEVQRKLAAGEPITGSKEDIVMAADIKTAAEQQAELNALAAAQQAAE
jgi:hypothetical protein